MEKMSRIDEVIQRLYDRVDNMDNEEELITEYIQIAHWLEELKVLKNILKDEGVSKNEVYNIEM